MYQEKMNTLKNKTCMNHRFHREQVIKTFLLYKKIYKAENISLQFSFASRDIFGTCYAINNCKFNNCMSNIL